MLRWCSNTPTRTYPFVLGFLTFRFISRLSKAWWQWARGDRCRRGVAKVWIIQGGPPVAHGVTTPVSRVKTPFITNRRPTLYQSDVNLLPRKVTKGPSLGKGSSAPIIDFQGLLAVKQQGCMLYICDQIPYAYIYIYTYIYTYTYPKTCFFLQTLWKGSYLTNYLGSNPPGCKSPLGFFHL